MNPQQHNNHRGGLPQTRRDAQRPPTLYGMRGYIRETKNPQKYSNEKENLSKNSRWKKKLSCKGIR